jgi:hypothetical protein
VRLLSRPPEQVGTSHTGGLYGGLALAGAGTYAGYKHMKKKASALDILALEAAEEILKVGGYEFSPGEDYDLDDMVTYRALEILAAEGYEIE